MMPGTGGWVGLTAIVLLVYLAVLSYLIFSRPPLATGTASWFRSPNGVSAAGPALRSALGPDWRGTRVVVTGPAGSAVTVVGDFMRADRLIDLDVPVFYATCGPLSLGLCHVTVTRA